MIRSLQLLIVCLLLLSCGGDSNDPLDGESLYGTWLLSEVLLDPGDGSGEFIPRDTGEELIIQPNSIYVSNWNICRLNSPVGKEYSGQFRETGNGTIELECPLDDGVFINAELEQGLLILNYPCIEPCAYRFYKIADFTE